MRDFRRMAVGGLACLMSAIPGSAQVPRFDPADVLASFDDMAEYLARDGGVWEAPNPTRRGPDSPLAYELRFERHVNGRVLSLEIVSLFEDGPVVSARGEWSWHPQRSALLYRSVDRAGGVTDGVTVFPDGRTFRTEATRYGPGGRAFRHRDENVLEGVDVHRNESFQVRPDGERSNGVYVWRRVADGPVGVSTP